MKNLHIVGIVFAAGLIIGAAVPAHAAPFTLIYESKVIAVDAEQCTIETDHSDTFEVPCEDAADYSIGDDIAIVNQNGVVVVEAN